MASDPIQNLPNSSRPAPGGAIDPASIRRSLQIDDKRARAEAVAGQLEGVFMDMMVKAMRQTVPEDGLFGQGMGGKNYVEMLDQQYAQIGGVPRDPRFHEVLVNQIMKTPEETGKALSRMRQDEGQAKAAGKPELKL